MGGEIECSSVKGERKNNGAGKVKCGRMWEMRGQGRREHMEMDN